MARTLRVMQISTGQWCQWIQRGPGRGVPEAAVKGNVAAIFGIPGDDLAVVETDWTWAEYEAALHEQAAGLHEGRAVMPQPVPPPKPDPDAELERALKAALSLQDLKDALLAHQKAKRRP